MTSVVQDIARILISSYVSRRVKFWWKPNYLVSCYIRRPFIFIWCSFHAIHALTFQNQL